VNEHDRPEAVVHVNLGGPDRNVFGGSASSVLARVERIREALADGDLPFVTGAVDQPR
jgi:hypothetical protein